MFASRQVVARQTEEGAQALLVPTAQHCIQQLGGVRASVDVVGAQGQVRMVNALVGVGDLQEKERALKGVSRFFPKELEKQRPSGRVGASGRKVERVTER